MNEIQQALRQIRLRPGLAVGVIAMLALGIGATTAMFSLFHQVLVRPLPVAEPERLVNLSESGPKPGALFCSPAGVCTIETAFSYPMFRDLEPELTILDGLAAHIAFNANIVADGQTLSGRGTLVSGGYFGTLGLQPALGRLIGPQDEPRIGESAVVVLSYDYWQSRFGGDGNIVGRTLTVNGKSLTIIGVAPEGFASTVLGWQPQLFTPLTMQWVLQPNAVGNQENRGAYWLQVFGRLPSELTFGEATAALSGPYSGIVSDREVLALANLSAEQARERRLTLTPGALGQSPIRATVAQPLTLLLGVTALVLLIACVNIANLLLARGASRAGELAIRSSIGATRGRLLSQLLTESSLLALVGGLLSLPVAAVTLEGIVSMLPDDLARNVVVGLDPVVALFAIVLMIVTVALFAAVPAWKASNTSPGDVLKAQAARSAGSRGLARFRAALTTMQVAFSMVLLVLAGLFTLSLANVAREDLGIEVDTLVSFSVSPSLNGYDSERVDDVYRRIEEQLTAQPGVDSVGSADMPLLANASFGFPMSATGFEGGDGADNNARANFVGPGFFETVSIPLLAGRSLTDTDTIDAPAVVVVNESFVQKFNLGTPSEAIGKRTGMTFVDEDMEIIGVVADAKYGEVKGAAEATFYAPRAQFADWDFGIPFLVFYVRSSIGADAMLGMIPGVVASVDPNLPVDNLASMRSQVNDNVYLDRLITMFSVGFAVLATLLAAIGLYGVLAYNVTQRTRELGLRLALGATSGSLRALVMKQVGLVGLVGALIGLAVAVGIGRSAEALLFGLSGYDLRVMLTAIAVLAVVVLAASYIPARRASNVGPMEALRHE
jgi:predicted permease